LHKKLVELHDLINSECFFVGIYPQTYTYLHVYAVISAHLHVGNIILDSFKKPIFL